MSGRPLWVSALRYGAAGLVNTAVGLGVIAGLEFGLGVQANLANAAGYAVGVCVAFVLSRLFVFGSARPLRSAGPRYVAAVLAAFVLNQAVLTIARAFTPEGEAFALAAQLSGMAAYTGALFLLSHYWVFASEARAAGPRAPAVEWALAVAAIGLAALALMAPALPRGLTWGDSHIYNSVWIPEFTAALGRGELVPRWLPGAFLGLGASSFYFYPPLAFYVAAGVQAVGAGLSVDQVTTWSGVVMLGLSGLAMYAWLRGRAGPALALLGAGLYMAAPYHLMCIYIRAAFAEASAFMVLPLVMLALEGAAGRWRRVALLGLAYALLICAHIGSALLATLTLIGPYALFLILQAPRRDRWATLARCFAGGVLGLALAAFYLAPALLLQGASEMAVMFTVKPGDWTLFQPQTWPVPRIAQALALCAWAALGVCLVALPAARGRPAFRPVLALSVTVLLGFGLYATAAAWTAPGLGPLLAKVQFPWRLLLVVDFAAISALMVAAAHGRRGWALLALPLALLSFQSLRLTNADFRFVVHPDAEPGFARQHVRMEMAPVEHLPAGVGWTGLQQPGEVARVAREPLARSLDPETRILAVRERPDGSLDLSVDAARPTRLVLRRFYFPAWRAQGSGVSSVAPHGPDRLASFVVPAGRGDYRLEIAPLPLERIGGAVSLAGLVAAAGLWFAGRRRRGASALSS